MRGKLEIRASDFDPVRVWSKSGAPPGARAAGRREALPVRVSRPTQVPRLARILAATMEAALMATVVALDASPANVLRSMRGSIVDAKKAYPDVLHVEIRDSAGELWRLATQDAEWLPADPPQLVGQVAFFLSSDPAFAGRSAKPTLRRRLVADQLDSISQAFPARSRSGLAWPKRPGARDSAGRRRRCARQPARRVPGARSQAPPGQRRPRAPTGRWRRGSFPRGSPRRSP